MARILVALTLISMAGGSFWLTTIHAQIASIERRVQEAEKKGQEVMTGQAVTQERLQGVDDRLKDITEKVEYIRRLLERQYGRSISGSRGGAP